LNKQAGFTLIELGVVIILISLFTLISIPLFSHTGRGDVQASARRLSGTVKYLFNEAALTGLEHRLIYNLDRGSYRALTLEADGSLVDVGGVGKTTALQRLSLIHISEPTRVYASSASHFPAAALSAPGK